MKKLFVCYALLIATACSATENHYLEGASSNFCVPAGSTIADIPWVPENKPGTPEGFAFAGCWRASGHAEVGCEMPKSVLDGSVQPRSTFRSKKWRDIDKGTLYKMVALSPHAEIKAAANGTVVVVQDQKLWRDWFIWVKAKPLTDESAPRLEDDDVVLAACHSESVATTSAADKRETVMCERSVLAADYALEYSFESDKRIPLDVKTIDAAVMSTLDHWRCKRSH
ncbi:hypothetical protein SAMN05216570_2137 [Dyella sp. OK004]|uniref:hypothetical protein n=1 Tax=Dyella sp. OK004 TaxID=1855292 RepID=UPI0008E3D0A9|nr:hypothetical protein [Dyella sp. OK004]SFS06404.1 hypothetical protein SAMN05216570_2137 [Dyella sp. OK004]